MGPGQRLNALWQVVNTAAKMTELTQQSRTYHFAVSQPITFYLQAENAEVRVGRWDMAQIKVTVRLRAAFGWRVATDQDEAGVYVVAKGRTMMGGLLRARFDVLVPENVYVMLKLESSRIVLENVDGTLELPPPSGPLAKHDEDAS